MTSSTGTNRLGKLKRQQNWGHRAPKCGRALAGRVLAASLIATGFLVGTANADVLYVSAEALPGGDGQSWDTAHRFLQDALAAAASGSGIAEVRVAQGVYKPDRSEAAPDGTGDRHATFTLISGVALLGGYAGPGFDDPDARDWEIYETILSGDLAGDDGPDFENYGENSFTVVTGIGTDANTLLEGFIIEGGNADIEPLISNPSEMLRGGGMYNSGADLTIRHCVFRFNFAQRGGAIQNIDVSNPTIDSCQFLHNHAARGGAIHVYLGGTTTIFDCSFQYHVATDDSGGIFATEADVAVSNSVFASNVTAGPGGAIFVRQGSLTVVGCDFVTNESVAGGAITHQNPSGPPLIAQSRFKGNIAIVGGGVVLEAFSPGPAGRIVDCEFIANEGGVMGGGLIAGGPVELTNCLFVKNESPWAAGIGYAFGTEIINCTIADNLGWGLESVKGSADTPGLIQNTIVWGNSQGQIYPNALALVFNSNIQGGWSGAGSGNLNADPLFSQPGTLNYRLAEGSPCIDVGDNSALPPDVTTDLAGGPRILNGIVDLGAYEGEHELLATATMAENLEPGQTAILSPLGTPSTDTPLVIFTNQSEQIAETVVVTHQYHNPHPDATGYDVLSATLGIEPEIEEGEFHATILLPMTAAELGSASPEDVRLTRFDEASHKWLVAINQNIGGTPDGPIIQVGTAFTSLKTTKGSYGFFWNPDQQLGVAWANVDRSGFFAAGINTCPADLNSDGFVTIMDLLIMVGAWESSDPAADLNNDGIVDMDDLLLLVSAWGPCP